MSMSETTTSPITRRSFLTGSAALGLGVATSLTLPGPQASAATVNDALIPAAPKAAAGDSVTVTDLEVMTVTPTSITFSWSTFKEPHTDHVLPNERVASDGEVWLARSDVKQPLRCVHKSYSKSGFHYVTIRGLKPNTMYRFECRSFGKKAEPGLWFTNIFNEPEVTGILTTLAQPTGKYIQTVAIANDSHLGKSGDSINSTPWSEIMVSTMLAEVKRRGIPHIFINGDLCDHGKLEEAKDLKRILSAFGDYQKDYYMVRGNHDGFGMPTPTSFDPIQAVFPKHKLQTCWTMDYGKLRVLGIDSSWPMTNSGFITDKQLKDIERILMQDPQRPTLVMAHHPVTEDAARNTVGWRPFILDKDDSLRLQRIFQKAPGVFFMAAGHTHRAHRDAPDLPGGPQFAQFCASTPFPGGFTLMDIYEGGYTVTFHRAPTAQALQQVALSRYKQSLGYYGEYTISRMHDRCFTVKRDMSALR